MKVNGVCNDHRRQSIVGPGRSYQSCLEGDISESMLPWRLMLHRALEVRVVETSLLFNIFAFIHLYRLKHSALGTTSPIMFNNSIQNNTYSPSNNFPKTPIAIVGNKVTIIRPIHRTILKSIRNVLPDSRWENIDVRICEPGIFADLETELFNYGLEASIRVSKIDMIVVVTTFAARSKSSITLVRSVSISSIVSGSTSSPTVLAAIISTCKI